MHTQTFYNAKPAGDISMRQRICLLALVLLWAGCNLCRAQPSPDYDKTVAQARKLMDTGKLAEAYLTASAAVTVDDKRWEAYAVVALVLNAQGASKDAITYVEKALVRAPEEKKATLRQMAQKFGQAAGTPNKDTASASGIAAAPVPATQLSGEVRRKYDALMLIIEDADKTKEADERKKLLREFMAKSADFLALSPMQTNIWVVRGAAAAEVDYPGAGWLVGRKFKELGLEESDDPGTRKVMAALERKGWLGKQGASRDWSSWTADQVRAAASEGDLEAELAMGRWYEYGISGFIKDEAEAVKWFRKAAEQGDAGAQYELGMMYSSGRGVSKDETEAVKWMRKVAEQGSGLAGVAGSAQFDLGYWYANGNGV